MPTFIDESHQVVEQAVRAEHSQTAAHTADHRGFIDEKKRVGMGVETNRKTAFDTFPTIDFPMNRRGRLTAVQRENFCRPTRRGQQHRLHAQSPKYADERTSQSRFSRACRTAQNHQRTVGTVGHKRRETLQSTVLFGSRLVTELLFHQLDKIGCSHWKIG